MTSTAPAASSPVLDPAPGAAGPTARRGSAGLIWGGIAIGLAIVILAVWALGGFAYRGDRIVKVAAGTTIDVGPYEFTFTSATVQHVTSDNTYEVIALGTGRTTKDKTIAPETGERSIVYSKNPAGGEVQPVKFFHLGESTDVIMSQDSFTPGLGPIRFTASFDYVQPVTDELLLVLFDQEFADDHIFGDNDPTWNRLDTGYSMTLPVTALPDRKF